MNAIKTLAPLPSAEILYDHWIYEGQSLRKIGRIYGRSRTTVWQAIRLVYGKEATNPRVNGLSRCVAAEYGRAHQSTVESARGIRGRYLTRKKEQNLTTFQSINLLDNFPVDVPEAHKEGLRLPMFVWFATGLTEVLRNSLVMLALGDAARVHEELV